MPFDPIPANEQLIELTVKHENATKAAIRAGDQEVIRAVAALTGERHKPLSLNCDIDEAEALVWASVEGRIRCVGERIYGIVEYAIFQYVTPLAEAELANMERRRKESADEARIDRATD